MFILVWPGHTTSAALVFERHDSIETLYLGALHLAYTGH